MSEAEIVDATSGGLQERFELDWKTRRWTSAVRYDMADYPFIAEISGKRYELYGDGTFDEEEVSRGGTAAERTNPS